MHGAVPASSKTARLVRAGAQLGTTTAFGARRSRRFTVGIRPALANPMATGFGCDEAASTPRSDELPSCSPLVVVPSCALRAGRISCGSFIELNVGSSRAELAREPVD